MGGTLSSRAGPLLAEPFRMQGVLGRRAYIGWAALLTAMKLAIDWLVGAKLFGLPLPLGDFLDLPSILRESDDRIAAVTLAVVSLPFLWAGVGITIRRLRDAGHSPWQALLLIVPFVKVLPVAMACVLPSVPRQDAMPENNDVRLGSGQASDPMPRPVAVAAWRAVAEGILVGTLGSLVGATLLGAYGWTTFLGLPFVMGWVVAVRSGDAGGGLARLVLLIGLALAGTAGLLLLLAAEGLACILMAAPIALLGALAGGVAGRAFRRCAPPGRWRVQSALVLALPLALGYERFAPPEAPIVAVTTVVEVEAPPATAWRHVVSFPAMPPPTEWIFRAGIAYPLRASIEGHGVGALRLCTFTTGSFVEPIEVWDEPRLLRFGVESNPPPMVEWNPWGPIDAPHLHGAFEAVAGEFRLTPLPGGRTLLEGTTWYRQRLWPSLYWRPWSNVIIHAIHGRVLAHVKALAERETDPARARMRGGSG